MKKLFQPLVIIFFAVVSCKSVNGKKSVQFAYKELYLLSDDELQKETDKIAVAEYEAFNGLPDYAIPLNRYIVSGSYKVYIGAAIQNKKDEIVSAFKGDSSFKIFKSKDTNAVSFFGKKGNLFAIKYIYEENVKKMPVIISLVSQDSLKLKKLYDTDYVKSKIN